jgi:hypothetical protein
MEVFRFGYSKVLTWKTDDLLEENPTSARIPQT